MAALGCQGPRRGHHTPHSSPFPGAGGRDARRSSGALSPDCRSWVGSPQPPDTRLASLPFGALPRRLPARSELTAAAAPVKMSSPSVSLSPASGSEPPAAPSDSGSSPGKGGGSLSEALQPPPPDAIFLHPRRKPQQQLYRERREQSVPERRGTRGPRRTLRDPRGGRGRGGGSLEGAEPRPQSIKSEPGTATPAIDGADPGAEEELRSAWFLCALLSNWLLRLPLNKGACN